MELTEKETKQILRQREKKTQKNQVKEIGGLFASGDISLKEAYKRVDKLAYVYENRKGNPMVKDCNCPSQFDMCYQCQHCLHTRVRCGIYY